MKMPLTPPKVTISENVKWPDWVKKIGNPQVEEYTQGKYLHWDKLMHLAPPPGLSVEEWWVSLKFQRESRYQRVPLLDTKKSPFVYILPDPIPEHLHKIDLQMGGGLEMPEQITNPEQRNRYIISSLIEEAITSSVIEGAVTTRAVAKEMIRTGRPPRDRSEQMIFNNYLAMKEISELKDQPLTKDLIFHIHGLVTEKTLDEKSTGRFRKTDDDIVVADLTGEIFHTPPKAEELDQRLAKFCDFANGKTPEGKFIHPVIRSIMMHFWLAYDHPFVDGNGRTARALFYWSLLHHGYWLFEFVSISTIIKKAPSQYERAFLYTETDDNDLTYFLLYHLDVLQKAIENLYAYLERKTAELKNTEQQIKTAYLLNARQKALLAHALRHPGFRYTIYSHQRSHKITYETARTDLMGLVEKGILQSMKVGKQYVFSAAKDFPIIQA